MKINAKSITQFLPGVVAALGAIGLGWLGGWTAMEQLAYNSLFRGRDVLPLWPSPEWDERIAIIAIDEKSLQAYGQFPWSRDRYVALLDELLFVQPASVSFDILFAEPSIDDAAFSQAVIDNDNVVLAVGSNQQGVELRPAPEIEALTQGAYEVGHVLHTPDSDGISRQISLCQGEFPSFSVMTLQVYQERLNNTLTVTVTTDDLADSPRHELIFPYHPLCSSSDDSLTVTTSDSPVWINWPGSILDSQSSSATLTATNTENALQTYSFVDVVNGTVDTHFLQNKIVLVGVTASGLDPARSPLNYDPPITGLYVHAAVIDNLLNNRFLHRPPPWSTPFVLILLGVGTSRLLSNQGSRQRIIIVFGIPLIWLGLSLLCFLGNWWIPVASPVGTVLMTIIGFQWQEQREKQQLMNLFSMHVAPQTAQLIWSRRDELLANGQLHPQELTATVLFMDIRGFTSISEKMPSHQLVPWLNRYFEVMTDCIMEHGGVVDKYIGDAIMAVFGIPFPRTDRAEIQQDAIAAIAASIDMYQRLQHLNVELTQQNLPTIAIGIGIHTGVLTAGSVGSQQRVNYSVFGDTVNTAARLESMTKTLLSDVPYPLLMSEQTFIYVKTTYQGKATGRLQLKGKEVETMTYTLAI